MNQGMRRASASVAGRNFSRCAAVLVFLAAALPGAVLFPLRPARFRGNREPKAQEPVARPAKSAAAPIFRIGERLQYQVGWGNDADAAAVELDVVEQRDLYGRPAWHFRAAAHTLGLLRVIFPLDDQLDSYSALSTLSSRQYEEHLRESGKSEDQIVLLIEPGNPARGPWPSVIVPGGTLDPVGAVYALREVDWGRPAELRAPVYDGEDFYEMAAQRESALDQVQVAAGQFTATRIGIRLSQHGREVPGTRFQLWLAEDAARTPVLLEAELPSGNFRVELAGAEETQALPAGANRFSFPGRSSLQEGK